jgi:hypothetical protein
VNFTAYYALNESSSEGNPSNAPSSNIDSVYFGLTSVYATKCGDGANVTTESVAWLNATVAPSTRQVFLEVVELLDGDIDGGPAPAPMVTFSSVCADSPPATSPSWYVVLEAPDGGNVAYFSYSTGWEILDHVNGAAPISNGSRLIVVANPLLTDRSFDLCTTGIVGTETLRACAEL